MFQLPKKVMIEISNNDDGIYEMNGWIDLLCSLFQRQLNILRTYIGVARAVLLGYGRRIT